MIIEKLTGAAQSFIEKACRLAVRHNHANVTHWHLLSALQADSVGISSAQGIDRDTLSLKLDIRLSGLDKALKNVQNTPISRDFERLLIAAEDLSQPDKIALHHLQLALLSREDVVEVLTASGAQPEDLRLAARGTEALEKQRVLSDRHSVDAESDESMISKYTRNLTQMARDGLLDPVIGRQNEIRVAIQILCRRIKNNPILIGEPGVGKTAVVEGLAQLVAGGDVPENLKNAPILSLDMGQMIAGAKYRGEFEERLKGLVTEVQALPKAILFIDEIHILIGAGKGEGSMDAANLLKPALSRGELTCVGATTLEEYRMHFEKDDALMRRFQTLEVPEPNYDETMTILRGLEEKYEKHHGVIITEAALDASIRLSQRYITDRYLPDKAIDLIDQTAAALRIRLSSKPEDLEAIDQRILTLNIEQRAIRNENNADRIQAIEAELGELKAESAKLTQTWERNRQGMEHVREAYRTLDDARQELHEKIQAEDFARVAELQYKIIPNAEKIVADFADIDLSATAVETAVTGEMIANTVEKLTGIPVSQLVDTERARLVQLESVLQARVVGQEEAVKAIARAIRRSKAGLQDPRRPMGSFLMLGPSGVGKTELAKTLADFLFDDEAAIIRFDMSEYMEKHAISRLTGAPPGYVGYEEGGLLTNRVRRKPYSVVLFDEVEKAHPDVFNLFLQMLDEGRLTDSQGHVVNFTNTVVLLTSNLGAQHIRPTVTSEEAAEVREKIMEAVRGHFKPEFLNRLDEILVFSQLTPDAMRPIVDIQLGQLMKLLAVQGIDIEVADEARDLLATWGYNPIYGARPLKRVVQSKLQDTLSDMLLQGELEANSLVKVGANDDRDALTFEVWG